MPADYPQPERFEEASLVLLNLCHPSSRKGLTKVIVHIPAISLKHDIAVATLACRRYREPTGFFYHFSAAAASPARRPKVQARL
jgi:hypothetical protein